MKNAIHIAISIYLMVSSISFLQGQTPVDGIMMDNGQICFAALYTHDTWDEYWEGTLKRSNGNVGTLTRQTFIPMVALGIGDRLNVIAALPYVMTEASGGQMRGSEGFQDVGIWLKGVAYENVGSVATFSTLVSLGASLPSSDYLADYSPFSLGLGCPDFSIRGILNYQANKGLFLRGQAGYLIRGNAKIERDYYYTTHGVYSDEVDMPNAVSWGATVGSWLLKNSLKIDATYDGLNTLGGHDIRRQDVGFPSNKMLFTRIGANAQFFIPFIPGLGIVGQWSQVLTGRNVGQSTAITAGLTYQFGLWNKEAVPETTN
ncbi:MAG TPA: transporter [Saprospiraceae bacterium]